MLRKIVIFLGICFWPISLYLANIPSDFINYFLPGVLVFVSFLLYKKESRFYYLPLLIIPVIQPKFAPLPLVFLISQKRFNKIPLLLALVVLIIFFKPFWGQSVFQPDYEASNALRARSLIYNSSIEARVFQSKYRVYSDKIISNFFALSDPNNYFFGFHPREIRVDNQNLQKFPFLALPFTLLGIFFLREYKYRNFAISLIFSLFFILCGILNYDRNDFILWIPLSMVFIYGIDTFQKKYPQFSKPTFVIFSIFTAVELFRIFIA